MMKNSNLKNRINKIVRYLLILVILCPFVLSCEKNPATKETKQMLFTIDTRLNLDNPTDKSYRVPIFAEKKLSNQSLIIEWGDGTTTEYPKGTALTAANCTHVYSTDGSYQIKIVATTYNPAKKTEYEFNPGSTQIIEVM